MSDGPEFPISRPSLGSLELAYVFEAVTSGWISSLGSFVTRFEDEFAAFCGTDHAVSVSNGTAALHLALHAHDIGPGDEVIVPGPVIHCHRKCGADDGCDASLC